MWFDAHLLAGVASGAVTALLLHPLDTVKVKLQVADGILHSSSSSPSSSSSRFLTVRGAVREIWQSEGGVRGFYRGLSPALIGAGASWGLYFFFYESAKRRLAGERAEKLTPLAHAYAAWESGTAVVFLTNPVWLVKTRMQVEGAKGVGNTAPYTSLRSALQNILVTDGFTGLYRGLIPALCLTSHGVVQFTTYEALKESTPGADGARLFTFGLISKILAAIVTYPYQVVKSRIQQRFEGETRTYTGLVDCAGKILKREGIKGFYKGFVANLMRVAPQSAVTLVIYESVLVALR